MASNLDKERSVERRWQTDWKNVKMSMNGVLIRF